jgi:hypothetical protein
MSKKGTIRKSHQRCSIWSPSVDHIVTSVFSPRTPHSRKELTREMYAPVVAECKHGMEIDRCFECRTPPEGVNAVVYITKGGTMFHNRANCRNISVGQAIASAQGMNTHPVEPVAYSQVALERDRCPSCCP